MFLPIYIYFELLSLLFALWFYKGLRKFKLSPFILVLLTGCLADVAGGKLSDLKISNYYIYNGYLIISTPLYFYAFFKMLNYTGLTKKLYIIISMLVVVFISLNLFFIQGYKEFNTYSLIIIEFVITLLSLLVLLKLFNDNDTTIMLQQHPYFWISGSTLIFSISTLAILGLQQFIQTNNLQLDGKNIYRILIPMLNIILSGCYIYAFSLCHKLTSKLLPQ